MFGLVTTKGARHTVLMAYRSQADWDSVDWFDSDREIAATLDVSHAAVSKRRKKIGHASLYRGNSEHQADKRTAARLV